MGPDLAGLRSSCGPSGDAHSFLALARQLEAEGELRLAATAYDRAFGLNPQNVEASKGRWSLLDRLAVIEHGLTFRYVPTGAFLMGSDGGDPDERPVHAVEVDEFWLSETPISWSTYCDLMRWEPPPLGRPRGSGTHWQDGSGAELSVLVEANKVRLQYCEDLTTGARTWWAHTPETDGWTRSDGTFISSREMFGEPSREDPSQPWRYGLKPMVGVSWQDAQRVCAHISSATTAFRLPTEAEWEKAARGGLINRLYPWGDEPPTASSCDFDRLDQLSILPMRRLPPNGYGLYAMSGGVWEWTSDRYDALSYQEGPSRNPTIPLGGRERVLRGGSWSDCADAVRVSFRMSRSTKPPWSGMTPNIGFRLCRVPRTKRPPGRTSASPSPSPRGRGSRPGSS
jgi:sulfatase modifying factor 1